MHLVLTALDDLFHLYLKKSFKGSTISVLFYIKKKLGLREVEVTQTHEMKMWRRLDLGSGGLSPEPQALGGDFTP